MDSTNQFDDEKPPRSKKERNGECAVSLQRTLVGILQVHGEATTDLIHTLMQWPPDVHKNVFGLAVHSLTRQGVIEQCGIAVSTRRANRGRLVRKWRLVDAATAEAWLTNHPPAEVEESLSELVARETAQ